MLSLLAHSVARRCPRLPVLAISAMNPRHPLPAEDLELIAALENDIVGSTSPHDLPSLTLMAREWVRCLLYAIRETFRILQLRWQVGLLVRKAKRNPADVVMKTWAFGSASLTEPADFYYGTLPHLLQRRGIGCVVLCGDVRGGEALTTFGRTALSQTHIRYVPEKALIPLWAPLVTAWNQLLTSFALRRISKTADDARLTAVCAYACLQSLKTYVTACTLYFHIASAAVKAWRARVFVTLYEGQHWEKPAWLGAKAAGRGCMTVGYQHTVIMPHSLSLLSPSGASWGPSAPDCVLCLGEATMAMMRPGHASRGTNLILFGSFRLASDDSARWAPKPDRRTVIVIPEGLFPEAKVLFNFALRAALSVPDYRFIFRCHPVLPFERVRPHLEVDPGAVPNVEISERPISSDFARASIVLYRGSSSVLYAVLSGLRPIYLHDQDYPDVDPLFELSQWRAHISSVEEMGALLRQYASTTEERAAAEWQGAARYVSTYTVPVSEAAVDRFLAAVGVATAVVAT